MLFRPNIISDMRALVFVLLSGLSLATGTRRLCLDMIAKDLDDMHFDDEYAAFFSVEPCLYHMWRQKLFFYDREMLAKLDTTEFLPEEVAPLIEEHMFPDATSFETGALFTTAAGLTEQRVRGIARAMFLMRILDELGRLPRPSWNCVRPLSPMISETHLSDLQRETFFVLTFSLVIAQGGGLAWDLLKRLANEEGISPVDLSQHVARIAIRHNQEWINKMFLCFDS